MKILIAFFALCTLSAHATEINLGPGSSATIRAGDEARVTCGGSGEDQSRCTCVVGNSDRDSSIPCSGSSVGYVLRIGGNFLKREGCWSGSELALVTRQCFEALKNEPLCR